MDKNTCCFFGHRKIVTTDILKAKLYHIIECLIITENVDTFLFGCNSDFNDLCYQIVCSLKINYPHIRRIYVRAQFPYINEEYRSHLLQQYEETYFPQHMLNAGKSRYVERNYEMINKSKFCIVYFDDKCSPPRRKNKNTDLLDYQPKSGTAISIAYAAKKQKNIINILKI